MAEVFDFGLQEHRIKMDGNYFENNLFAVAGDTGRRLEVQLLDVNGLIQNTTGITLRLNAEVAGQVTYAQATLIDATTGAYELDLPNGMLLAPGDWEFQWMITDALGKKLHSSTFVATIGSNLAEGASQAVNFYMNVEELEAKTVELEERFYQFVEDTNAAVIPEESITENKLSPSAVGNKNVKSEAITGDKTTFLEATRNLFNKYAVSTGKRVASGTGLLIDVVGVNTSDYIEVSSLTNAFLRRSHTPEAYVFYDVNKQYISGGSSSSSTNPIPIPTNAVYIRTSVKDANLETYQIEYGSVSTEYVPFYSKLSEDISFEVTPEKTTFLTNSQGKNLFNKAEAVAESAWLYSAGTLISYAGYHASGLMPVVPGQRITRNYKHSTVFFNDKKAFVSGLSNSDSANTLTITIPSGVHYMATTVINSMFDTYQVEEGEITTSYEAYKEMYVLDKELKTTTSSGGTTPIQPEPWAGDRIIANGDSIMAGWTPSGYETITPYPSLIATELGMALSNYAIGGSTISVKESAPTERNPIVTRFSSMDDGDVIIIAGGTNDWWYDWTPLGDMTSRSNFTFYGALHNLCLGLLNKYPGKPILFLTPIKRYDNPLTVNANGKTLKEYGEIIKEVCDYYSIKVTDLWTESVLNTHVASQKALFIPDGTHPNNAGQMIMKRPVKRDITGFY